MSSPLNDRVLLYDTTERRRTKVLTTSAAQGSVLGPDIWNIDYDGILGLKGQPEGASLEEYSDDIVLVITVKNLEEAQRKLDADMRHILSGFREHSLQLATQKSEIVLLTRKSNTYIVPVNIADVTIETKASVKYLRLWLDNKVGFVEHIRQACEKATRVAATLSWLMVNVGGLKPSRRRLLISVVHSILLYGAEVWAENLVVYIHRKKPGAVQRRCALRVACSYRTVSDEAVLVIAGVMPIRLMKATKISLR